MISRLLVDMIRRLPNRHVAMIAAMLLLSWSLSPWQRGASIAIPFSLAFAYVAGPLSMLVRLQTPLVPYLPVSRRDVWRATWIMSTLAPVAMTTAMKVPAALVGGAAMWSTITVTSTIELLYAGAGCALALLAIGLIWPLVAHASLPAQWSDLQAWHWIVLAIGGALTVWGSVQPPPHVWQRPWRPQATTSTLDAAPLEPSRLSGLHRLLVHELASSLILGAMVVTIFLGLAFFVDGEFGRTTTLHDFLGAHMLLLFDRETLQRAALNYDLSRQFGWYGFYTAAMWVRFPQLLRHLRVLPLGTTRLHALLLAWPGLVWTIVWVLLAGVHLAIVGPYVTAGYQLPLLFALTGMSALGLALGLRFAGGWPPGVVASLPMLIPFGRLIVMPPLPLVTIGAVSFGAAMAVNGSALSRGTTYKRADLLVPRAQNS